MTCFQNVPRDSTTKAVAVVSGAVTVRGEHSATKTPVTALPVNLGGFPHFVSNVNLSSFSFFFSFYSFLFPQPRPAGWLQTTWAACPNCLPRV